MDEQFPLTLKRNFEFFFDHAGYVVGDPDLNYRRVVEAELASEAMAREQELDRAMRL